MQITATVGLFLDSRSGSRTAQDDESADVAVPGRGPRLGKILIMDDERQIRETMHRQLAICGYEVTAVVHGEDAVNAFVLAREAGQPFDAVILDLVVPGGWWGGEQTLAALLRLDPGVKALVCSGSLEGPREHYEKKGFRGVLGKPYLLSQLRGAVEAMLVAPNGL